ncbi:MAG: recombinase family protein, partial [Nevskiales bacterium]
LSFIDDGVSGTTLVRPALERLRDQAAAGAIERLYVLAPDRLARRHAHQMVLVDEMHACGVELVFLNGPLGQTPEDQLLLQVQGIIAEYERAKILERTRRGRLHAARCGQVSVLVQAPYGYRYRDKHSGGGRASFEILEDEARVVRQIFAWVAHEGCTLWDVAKRLHAQGVPTRTGRERWNPGTLSYLVRNRTYCGQAAFNKEGRTERRPRLRPRRGQPEVPRQTYSTYRRPASEHILIPVPALLDEDLFAAAQERMAENRRRRRQRHSGARYLLQGLLVCSRCGYAWTGFQSARGRAPHYRCGGAMNYRLTGQPLCRLGQQRTDDLDSAVWQDVCALLSEPDRLRHEFERRQQRPAGGPLPAEQERLRGVRAKVKQSISRLIDAY